MSVPDDLVTAIKAAHLDPDVPAQGYAELRAHVVDGAGPPTDLDDWLETQRRAQAMVAELAERLPPVTPGELPGHMLEWWYPVLSYPWAEDLAVAVTCGFIHLADA